MIRKYLQLNLFLWVSLVSFNIKGQDTGYMEGYIVTSNNDTLMGFVKNKNFTPYRVLEKIKFKKDKDSKVEIFAPDQLIGFKIGTHSYTSKNTTAASGFNERLFLEVIIEGRLSYYKLEHTGFGAGNVSEYVILQKQGEESELSYMLNVITFNFKKNLIKYIKDAPTLCDDVNNGVYSKNNINELVMEYNRLMNGK